MNKNKKFILLLIILGLITIGFITIKTNEYTRNRLNTKIEKLLQNKDYSSLSDIFYNYDNLEKICETLKISREEAEEIYDYFYYRRLYEERDYDSIAIGLEDLNPELCWKFRDDAKKFKDSVMKSAEYRKAVDKLEKENIRNIEISKKAEEFEKWKVDHISEIAPYEGMSEKLIRKTSLGKEYYRYESEYEDISNDSWSYEAKYTWKNKVYNTICEVIVGMDTYDKEAVVKRVKYIGEDWKIEKIFGYDEFSVHKYIGKLDSEDKYEDYSEYQESVEDKIEGYISEYDVYEYSDADEFYYDHKDDFEGYYDAEQYYEDAWSLIDENTEYLIE